MESTWTDYLKGELRTLLAEVEAGQQPSNIALYEAVCHELRPTYELENRPRRHEWPDYHEVID